MAEVIYQEFHQGALTTVTEHARQSVTTNGLFVGQMRHHLEMHLTIRRVIGGYVYQTERNSSHPLDGSGKVGIQDAAEFIIADQIHSVEDQMKQIVEVWQEDIRPYRRWAEENLQREHEFDLVGWFKGQPIKCKSKYDQVQFDLRWAGEIALPPPAPVSYATRSDMHLYGQMENAYRYMGSTRAKWMHARRRGF